MNQLEKTWNLGTFYGGPACGQPVEIMGAFRPVRIGHAKWPGGDYRWDGARYAWVQG
jgi:hypothetical protein